MPRRGPKDGVPTWTPNQVVASNLTRLRQRRGLTQGEAARILSTVAGKEWTEAMVAHAERSVTGNRIREFTADDLVTMARAFDVPVLYFLTPPPSGLFISVPDSPRYGITTLDMMQAVLGRLDNLSEWETLLDEWDFSDEDELPFPMSEERRQRIRTVAREVALIRGQHVIRRHFKGNLLQLEATLRSIADLVRSVETHEAMAELDEDEHMKRIEAMRKDVEKGRRLVQASEELDALTLAEYEERQKAKAKKGRTRP